jgi:hypothetical protein
MYTLKEAAEATGRGKPAILKAIQKGRISAKKNPLGEWRIDPSELHRVYPPVSIGVSNGNGDELEETALETMQLKMELALKDEKIRSLERQIETLETVKDDLREDRDHWRKQAQQATLLLVHQQDQIQENNNENKSLIDKMKFLFNSF